MRKITCTHLFQGTSTSSEIESSMDLEIVEGDIEASNGIVHLIDRVIE